MIRTRGFRDTCGALVSYVRANTFRYEFDAYIVLRRRPPTTDASTARSHDLRFAPVELDRPDSLEALIEAWPPEWRTGTTDSLRALIETELRSGDECYAYWQGERIVAASWVGFRNSPYLKKFAAGFGLNDDEALRRTTFVVPGQRGRRLQVLLAAEVEQHVSKTRGIRRFLVYVGIRNTASLRNLTKVYEEVRPLYHARITIFGKSIDWFPKKNEQSWAPIKQPSDPGT